MFLEIATTVGALLGTVVAVYVSSSTLAVIFGIVLLFSSAQSLRQRVEHIAEHRARHRSATGSGSARRTRVDGKLVSYGVDARAGGVRNDVRRRHAVGAARHRLGSGEGARDGPRDASARTRCPRPRAIS